MAVAVLMMVAGAQGLNYTTNGWECTAEAMGRNANCKTECEGFTALVVNQEESDKKTDDKKHCKIAARTVMEIMDAMTMRGPSEGPSGEDINLPAAMRPMNDVALNQKINLLFTDDDVANKSHCYIDLESRWRTRDLECTDRADKDQMMQTSLLRLVDDILPYYHKVHTTSDDQDKHNYCLVAMRRIMHDSDSSMFPLFQPDGSDGSCKASHPTFTKYTDDTCNEACWKATVDNMKRATGGSDGKGEWQCCALLYYDHMLGYTYGNGKPESGKDFNTLEQYDGGEKVEGKSVTKGSACETVPCTSFPDAVNMCKKKAFATGDYALPDEKWGIAQNCYSEKNH